MNYRGQLLAAHPKRPHDYLKESVVIVVDSQELGSWGLQINWPHRGPISLSSILENQGMWTDSDCEVYYGGQYNLTRCFLLHSLDWNSSTTIPITENLGITGDLSILAAIVGDQGPEKFRPIIGCHRWGANELQQEISGQSGIDNSWIIQAATPELVFDYQGQDQWTAVIAEYQIRAIDKYF